MKKLLLILLCLPILFVTCNIEQPIDKSNLESIGEIVHKAFLNKDSLLLKKLIGKVSRPDYQLSSFDFIAKELYLTLDVYPNLTNEEIFVKFPEFNYNEDTLKKYKARVLEIRNGALSSYKKLYDVIEFEFDSLVLNSVYTKDVELLVIKTDTASNLRLTGDADIQIYLRNTNIYYKILVVCNKDINNEYSIGNISIYNMTKECDDYKNNPYVPSMYPTNVFYQMGWTYSGKTINDLYIDFKNDLVLGDIEYLKFKLYIGDSENFWRGDPWKTEHPKGAFFEQTIVRNMKVYEGDKTRIYIDEIKDFYSGVINNDLTYKCYLLEIKPKPSSEDCEMIEDYEKIEE